MYITPPFLTKGDAISIVATARKVSETEMKPAVEKFQSWGLKVVLGKNLFKEQNQYAGCDEERIADLQMALDDDTVKAVVIARGGYGTMRIIDKLDFTKFKSKPKWIVGYSDVTVLHTHINQNFEIETLHATMPINFPENGRDNHAVISLKKSLFGESLTYQIENHIMNVKGVAEGVLLGGNLSLLYALAGSESDINTRGAILFIEDLDEYLYHIDRMMISMKRSGKLKHLAGMIVGGMTEMKDNAIPFGKNAYEIVKDAIKEYQFPVCFNFPAGHIEDNRALVMGRKIKLQVGSNIVKTEF